LDVVAEAAELVRIRPHRCTVENKLLFVKGDRMMPVVSEKQRILREKNGTRRREGGMVREELVRED
jgi:hypothetical protein